MRLRSLSEYGFVACSAERPARETQAEQHSDTGLVLGCKELSVRMDDVNVSRLRQVLNFQEVLGHFVEGAKMPFGEGGTESSEALDVLGRCLDRDHAGAELVYIDLSMHEGSQGFSLLLQRPVPRQGLHSGLQDPVGEVVDVHDLHGIGEEVTLSDCEVQGGLVCEHRIKDVRRSATSASTPGSVRHTVTEWRPLGNGFLVWTRFEEIGMHAVLSQ